MRNCWIFGTTRAKLHKKRTTQHFLKNLQDGLHECGDQRNDQLPKEAFLHYGHLGMFQLSSWVSDRFSIEHVKFCVQVHLIVWVPFLHARAPGELIFRWSLAPGDLGCCDSTRLGTIWHPKWKVHVYFVGICSKKTSFPKKEDNAW